MKEDEIEERSLVEARGHLSSNQTDSHLAHLRSSREALDRLDSTITGRLILKSLLLRAESSWSAPLSSRKSTCGAANLDCSTCPSDELVGSSITCVLKVVLICPPREWLGCWIHHLNTITQIRLATLTTMTSRKIEHQP